MEIRYCSKTYSSALIFEYPCIKNNSHKKKHNCKKIKSVTIGIIDNDTACRILHFRRGRIKNLQKDLFTDYAGRKSIASICKYKAIVSPHKNSGNMCKCILRRCRSRKIQLVFGTGPGKPFVAKNK